MASLVFYPSTYCCMQIKSYRGIIVRLKEEFIKSEEERAVSEVHQKSKASQSGPSHAASDEDLEALRLQV